MFIVTVQLIVKQFKNKLRYKMKSLFLLYNIYPDKEQAAVINTLVAAGRESIIFSAMNAPIL